MNSYSSLKVQGESIYTNNHNFPTPEQTILKLLRKAVGDTTLASEFCQVWVLRKFQLGDDLTSYIPERQTEDNNDFLYLVCQGRVRLLGFGTAFEREVSTQLLLAEQTFGADRLFSYQPLPYRAVAASTGVVAYISLDELKYWLQLLPNLETTFRQDTCERQALIFFKTATELRSHTSHSLRQLLPYLVQTKIGVGSTLAEATPPSQGRFWLIRGQIISPTAATQPPLIGASWGYPDSTIPDWIAKTDLQVYHLPRENGELLDAIAPEIFVNKGDRGKGKGERGHGGHGG